VSRLQRLSIPFVQGHDDSVAAEVLPDGVLADLRNGRFNKAGELALRTGWRPVDMSSMPSDGTVTARDLYSYGESLVALHVDSVGKSQLAAYANPTSTQPWYLGANFLPPARDVRRIGGMPADDRFVTRASAALTADGVYGAVLQQSSAGAGLRIFRTATDETLSYVSVTSSTDPLKVVSLGTRFGLVRNTGAALTLQFADPTTGSPTFGGTVTLVTATVTDFDAVTAVVASPAALYVAWVAGGNVSFGRFDITTGAQVGATKAVDASGGRAYVALASNDTRVAVVHQATVAQTLTLLTFDAASPFGTDAGPTLLSTTPIVEAWFSVGIDSTGTASVAAQDDEASSAAGYQVLCLRRSSSHAVSSSSVRSGHTLAGGVVVLGTEARQVSFTSSRDLAVVQCGFFDEAQPWFVAHGLGNEMGDGVGSDDPPYYPAQSAAGLYLVMGRNTDRQPVVRSFRYAPTERRQGVIANGELYVTGGVLTRWSGVATSESGILAPVFFSLTGSNGIGSLTPAGVYKYRAIIRWADSRGADFQGEVSVEEEITLGASDDTVTAVVYLPPTLARTSDLVVAPSLELYRTEAGPGELFYLTDVENGLSASNDEVTATDTTSDASLVDEARIYTEGETGATSGRLSNVLPRPCSYAAATRDRLVLGGPDPEYQISQLALASEPVLFTDPGVDGPVALVYYDQVDTAVTAVATLDDTIVVGTARSLFVTGGDGPNFAGQGEFTSPARLPSNVGFYDWRSIVESDQGLWFLGDVDKLFLLPRGQGTPAWVGEAVQTRLAGGVVGAARDSFAHVLGWAVAGASPEVVIRDLVLGAWSGDTLPFTPSSLVGHAGHFWATAASTGVVWEQSLTAYGDGAAGATAVALRATTGDVQVFGLAGHGRLATLEVEGVFQAAAALLMEVSYDQGLTWTALGTHTVTGLTTGEVFQRQWYPARQRGGKFRLRLTMTPTVTTTEGCRLTGLSVYHTTRSGPTRLASAKRL
jgi:hypothetical protein